jgi:2-keto-3-deoxy-L-arabinonate dehydratase
MIKDSTSTTLTLAGVLPVFQTPYYDDETIDYGALDCEINWLLEHGADGIVMAMVSEILRLSTEERRELAAATCRMVAGRGSVIISVGAESSKLAEDFARHAEQCGADALMAIPPVATAMGEGEAIRYFSRIIRCVKIPLIVQDASGYVGRPLSLELYVTLLNEFGERVFFKPEASPIGPRLSALRDATGGTVRVFEGSGGIALVDSYRRGIVGTIPGADLIQGMVALWQALKAGDDSRAYRLSLPISALVALQTSLDGFLAVEKYLLVKQGVLPNTLVRGPVGFMLDEETRREIDRLFELVSRALEVEGKR